MESIFPRGSVPTMQNNFLTINGTCTFSETNHRNVRVGTKLRTIYGVYFQSRQFEEKILMPQLPYDLGTASDGTKYFDFQIPAGYEVSYFIVGSEAVEAQELNTEFSVIDDDVPALDFSKFHTHDGENSPKIAAGTVNIRDLYIGAARAPSLIGLDSAGNIVFYNIPVDIPGAFVLTAPIDGFEFDATAGGTLAFTWDSASGASSYDIVITDNTSKTENYAGTGVSSGMTRNKSTFTNGHEYSWVVTAINSSGSRSSAAFTFSCAEPS